MKDNIYVETIDSKCHQAYPVVPQSTGHSDPETYSCSSTKGPQTVSLHTSDESLRQSENLIVTLSDRVVALVQASGPAGMTIAQVEDQLRDHKAHSVSPCFSRLIRQGRLVRVQIGRTKPAKRFPNGKPKYLTRFDPETRRNVTLHWVPEFAPESAKAKIC